MFYFILSIHLLLCFSLIGLVMLQQGKGADAGPALGGNSNSLFGASGATAFVVKATTACAVLFMITSILLVKHYKSAVVTEGSVSERLQGSLLKGAVEKELEKDKIIDEEKLGASNTSENSEPPIATISPSTTTTDTTTSSTESVIMPTPKSEINTSETPLPLAIITPSISPTIAPLTQSSSNKKSESSKQNR